MTSLINSLLLLFYSFVMSLIRPLVSVLGLVSPRLKAQTVGREDVGDLARRLAPLRASKQRAALFYCSSAGEYEQARPLIERLETDPGTFVHVIFFSRSGLDYATARGDRISASLAPLGDSTWEWGWLLSAIRPDLTAVVRYELWPAFLAAAGSYGQLHLLAASRGLGESTSRVKRFARSRLLRDFDLVHAVEPADAEFFHATYGVPRERLRVSGDPKYDRVLERAAARAAETATVKARLDRSSPGRLRLIVGSAHRPDVEATLTALRQLGPTAASWQVVIAPHDVSPQMIGWIHAACRDAQLAAVSYSQLVEHDGVNGSDERRNGRWSIVILDTMGILAEVYGAGDAALVGGALHHKVHNVLEPACRGLALAYGPLYKNSQEAVRLVAAGLADIVRDGNELAGWWQGLEGGLAERAAATKRAVGDLAGATDRILRTWAPWHSVLQLPKIPNVK